MSRKLWWIFFISIFLFSYDIGLAKGQLVVTAPGGGTVDLKKNVMKYRGSNSKLVEVRWENSVLEASYLEYNGNQETLKGKDKVKVVQTAPVRRVLTANEVNADLTQNCFVASQEVIFTYDEKTLITGNLMEWDRKNDLLKISGQAVVKYKDWLLKGNSMEGQLEKGYFTVFGQVEATNKNNIIRGGRLIYNRPINKIFIQDNPVLIRGNNEMTASEIIYNLATNQILANGTVKTRIIDEEDKAP